MKLNNYQIYQIANEIIDAFENSNLYIPATANFYLQQNIKILTEAAKEIDYYRLSIAQHYGALNEDGTQYIVPSELQSEATHELNDLFSLEQELNIKTISIEAFKNVSLSEQQMKAMMFMIKD